MIQRRHARLLCLPLLIFLGWNCQPGKNAGSAPDLEITWMLNGNVTAGDNTTHSATFNIINRGSTTLGDKDWALHWNQSPRRINSTEGPAQVEIINGDFYKMTPREGFKLEPGDSVSITYVANDFMIKVSDGPLGLYLAYAENGEEKTLPIAKFTVLPFDKKEQYTRGANDSEPFPDPAFLYRRNERISVLDPEARYPFVPSPKAWQPGKGSFTLPADCRITASPELKAEADYLAAQLGSNFGLKPQTGGSGQAAVSLATSRGIANPEGYTLTVNAEKGILIEGGSPAGVFYGIQSLLSLLRTEAGSAVAPVCQVNDQPAFGYRGLHIDVGRNFQSKETILRLLDVMARYKLNKLHFNLTEDEGWRLEINGLPELTEVGGRRGHQHRDSLCLQPGYGSGPDYSDPDSHGNGYYTRDDFKEIIRYAHQRHIEVIPEVNMPGHIRSAIKAMELRYDRLMAQGKTEEANRYRLIDPDDTSKYISAQGYKDNTACVCRDQIYNFFEVVLDDMIAMYKEAEVPFRMFHAGGDEVPATAWTESPICKEFLKNYPEIKNSRNLQGLFFGKMSEIIRRRGLQTGAWEEAVMIFEDGGKWRPSPDHIGKEVYPYVWNSLWGNQDLGYRLANAGYPVILCNVTNFYFDLAYNNDPREPGLYWAGFVDEEKPFSFVPYDLYQSTWTDQMGKPFVPARDFVGMERLTPTGKANIAGLQAQLWSETVKGRDMLEYYYLPKLFGFSQRAWQGQAAWKGDWEDPGRLADWNRFMNTVVQVEFPFLEKHRDGYNYRIPPPGILAENGQIKMNTAYPGFQIRYTLDGSEPTASSPLYDKPIPDEGKTIRAACFNSSGRCGMTSTYKKTVQ